MDVEKDDRGYIKMNNLKGKKKSRWKSHHHEKNVRRHRKATRHKHRRKLHNQFSDIDDIINRDLKGDITITPFYQGTKGDTNY